MLLTAVAEGLAYGGLYALLGVGFYLTYGVLKRIDLAYGTVTMASVYLAAMLVRTHSIPWQFSFLLAFVFAIATSLLIAWIAFVLIRDERYSMAATLGFWMAIEELLFQSPGGGRGQHVSSGGYDTAVTIFGVNVRFDHIILLILSLVVGFLLSLFLARTRVGLALRVATYDRATAQLLGMSPFQTWVIATTLAATVGCLAGWAFAASQSAIDVHFGMWATLKGLVILALAGTSSLQMVICAALALGVIEKALSELSGPGQRDLFALGLMLSVLLAGSLSAKREVGGAPRQ